MEGEEICWGDLYGGIATATGWTWDTIDNLSLPQVEELYAYWAKHPPTHILVAAYMGIKPKGETRRPTEQDLSEFIAFLGPQARFEG